MFSFFLVLGGVGEVRPHWMEGERTLKRGRVGFLACGRMVEGVCGGSDSATRTQKCTS